MFILQCVGWFIFSCMLMSFIEHQVHSRLMHKRNWLSQRKASFQRIFEAHAITHHKHYSKFFADEPVAPGEDKEIRLNVHKAPIKAIPFAIVLSLISWQAGIIFVGVVAMHHWIWNKVHLEMHKPENRSFSKWPAYQFLARYHWLHHRYPDKNFNVVFPFADYVLGTCAKPNAADLKKMHEELASAGQPKKIEQEEVKELVSSSK